jgi:hypothetical protein
MAIGNYNIFTWLFGAFTPLETYAIIGLSIIIGIGVILWLIKRRMTRDPNEPLSTVDEFDKSGYVHVNEIEREAEGSSFLWFERANGDIDDKQIGQPFTFTMQDGTVERHHLNARGAYRCLDPKHLFKGFVFSLKEINRLAALTEQHIKTLRTGAYQNEKPSRHLRTFILLFLLAGAVGAAVAVATIHGVHA